MGQTSKSKVGSLVDFVHDLYITLVTTLSQKRVSNGFWDQTLCLPQGIASGRGKEHILPRSR